MKRDEVMKRVYDDRDPGVSGIRDLLFSIWHVDDIDWNATKKEMSRFPAGRNAVRQMEKLPFFEEIKKKGGYDKVVRSLPRDEQRLIYDPWEDFESKVLRKIEEPYLAFKGKEYSKTGSIAMNRKLVARELIHIAKMLNAVWPTKVKPGGLRGAMGLKKDVPLEDQASPGDVAKFFDGADKKGRGMVMFAVNSNQDQAFWRKVGDMIKPD